MTKVLVITLPQLARKLNVHRSTVKRLEDRKIIDAGKWVNGKRVYTVEMVRKITQQFEAHMVQRTPDGQMTVDSSMLSDKRQ